MRRAGNNGIRGSIGLAGLVLAFASSQGTAKTYTVSNTGNDGGDGSAAAPYKTIAKAASMVAAGDTVLVSAGTYSEKNIAPKSSGTQAARIVFKPAPGTGTVIIKHPATAADDTPIFSLSSRNFIWIEGFTFKDFKYGRASIYITGGNNNVVINNRFENLGNGEVATWNGNSVVAIYNASRNVVRNNYFHNIIGDGVAVNSSTSLNNLVTENSFVKFVGKLRSWGGTGLFTRAIDVQDMSGGNNVVSFNRGDSLTQLVWLDRNGSGNVILRNFGTNSSGFIFNESRCSSNVIQENIGYKVGTAFQTARYSSTQFTYAPRWIGNVAYKNSIGFYVHMSYRDEFRNNISFDNSSSNLTFTSTALAGTPWLFTNNLWFTPSVANSMEIGGTKMTVASYQTKVKETGGLSVDPKFTSPGNTAEGYVLQSTSPAKMAGSNGVDLGAYATYGYRPVGWNPAMDLSKTQIEFESVNNRVARGASIALGVVLSRPATEKITVDVVPVAGDARSGVDFVIEGGTLVFNPGESRKTVTVKLTGSSTYEELVALTFANAVNGQAGGLAQTILRIQAGTGPSAIGADVRGSTARRATYDPATFSVTASGAGSRLRVELFSHDGRRAFERSADLGAIPTTIALPARTLKGVFLLRTSVDGREDSRRITLF
jgi:hypothetical protein